MEKQKGKANNKKTTLNRKKGIENNKKAATNFEAAAKSHLKAATHYKNGNNEKAAKSTLEAQGFANIANEAQKKDMKNHISKV